MIGFKRIRSNVIILISHGIVARILSILQPILIAFYIGAGSSTDTYFLAFTATTLVTKIVTEGMLASSIPLYQQIDKRDGLKGRVDFTNNLLNTYSFIALALVIVGIIFAPFIIRVFGPGFSGEEFSQAVRLFRIGVPYLFFDIIRIIGSGYLQSIHAFKAGARSGISYNLVFIIYLLFLSQYFGMEGLMVAGIVAVISQIIILWKPVFKGGYRYKLQVLIKDRLLVRFNTFMFPILMGVGVNQVNLVIDNAIGSTLESGTVSGLNYANDIITFFITLIIMALVTAIFPILSERFRDDDSKTVKESFRYSLKLMILTSVPLVILFITLAGPLVRLFYQRGEFSLEDTAAIAGILRYYAPAVVGMSLLLLLNRIFYAVHSVITPVVIGLISLVFNAVLSIVFSRFFGPEGIALGTTVSVTLVTLYAMTKLNLMYEIFSFRVAISTLSKIFVAGLAMAAIILFLNSDLGGILELSGLGNMVLVFISAGLGLIVYSAVARLMKV